MSHEYKPIATPCDLSEASLIEAAKDLVPSRIFKLHVGAGYSYWDGKRLLVQQHEREDNPLHPYINLVTHDDLKESEWYLEDEQGNKVGSVGAG